ncbi:uncharacterized protein DS421_13g437520 [Arachis hypogaea]|nr:uncharacterized protein DS421_13g437520 [Arachis hypogaea]
MMVVQVIHYWLVYKEPDSYFGNHKIRHFCSLVETSVAQSSEFVFSGYWPIALDKRDCAFLPRQGALRSLGTHNFVHILFSIRARRKKIDRTNVSIDFISLKVVI